MKFLNNLKSQKVWVNWKFDTTRGKIPINPLTGGNAMSNNSKTWADYNIAFKNKFKYDGIGFIFSNGVWGVDIDGADGHTKTNLLQKEILKLFEGTYTETSPSVAGIHIIFTCDVSRIPTITSQNGAVKLNPNYYQKNTKSGLECYFSGLTNRFFTYTGNQISNTNEITDKTDEVLYLLQKYMYRGEEKKTCKH